MTGRSKADRSKDDNDRALLARVATKQSVMGSHYATVRSCPTRSSSGEVLVRVVDVAFDVVFVFEHKIVVGELGEVGVSINFNVQRRNVDAVGDRQGLFVEGTSADDKNRAVMLRSDGNRLIQ